MNRKQRAIVGTAASTLRLAGYERDAKRLDRILADEIRGSDDYAAAWKFATQERDCPAKRAEVFAFRVVESGLYTGAQGSVDLPKAWEWWLGIQ